MSLLTVYNLSIAVGTQGVVHNVSFSVDSGKTLGIVGESGCGKSLTSLAIMGLLEGTQVNVTGGEIHLGGRNLLEMAPASRRALMGDEMGMIFQEPMTSLNPVYRIADQLIEMILQHRRIGKKAALARAGELLERVGIPDPTARLQQYPHQLSGGQRQRVMIALALACQPSLLIADEPTTALDVTVQAQILALLRDLQRDNGMAVMLISHDLGVIAENCQHVAVMYRGRIVESAGADLLFAEPRHPYTRGLLASIPEADHDIESLQAIPGSVPTIDEVIQGCAFHPRCAAAQESCAIRSPQLQGEQHRIACHFPLQPAGGGQV